MKRLKRVHLPWMSTANVQAIKLCHSRHLMYLTHHMGVFGRRNMRYSLVQYLLRHLKKRAVVQLVNWYLYASETEKKRNMKHQRTQGSIKQEVQCKEKFFFNVYHVSHARDERRCTLYIKVGSDADANCITWYSLAHYILYWTHTKQPLSSKKRWHA